MATQLTCRKDILAEGISHHQHLRSRQIQSTDTQGVDFGIDWRLNNRWGICADLSWGLNGVFKKDFETIEQTMYPIYGSVGITYQLK